MRKTETHAIKTADKPLVQEKKQKEAQDKKRDWVPASYVPKKADPPVVETKPKKQMTNVTKIEVVANASTRLHDIAKFKEQQMQMLEYKHRDTELTLRPKTLSSHRRSQYSIKKFETLNRSNQKNNQLGLAAKEDGSQVSSQPNKPAENGTDEIKVYTSDLYQYLYQSDKKTKDEIEKFEKIKSDKEVVGCTFRPETNYTKAQVKR